MSVIQYLSLAFNLTGPRDVFIGTYWSLPIEFQYYLILPLSIFWMSNRFNAIFIPIAFGAIFYAFYNYQLLPVNRSEVFQLGFTFFGGVILAHIHSLIKIPISTPIGISAFSVLVFSAGLIVTELKIHP